MGKMKSASRPAEKGMRHPVIRPEKPSVLTPEQRARLEAFDRYIAKCMDDDSGEQEETWRVLKKALDDRWADL